MLKSENQKYLNTVIATVSTRGGELTVIGGNEEKRALRQAKKETTFCYVRDIFSKSTIRLHLINKEWVVENKNTINTVIVRHKDG